MACWLPWLAEEAHDPTWERRGWYIVGAIWLALWAAGLWFYILAK